MKPTTRSEMLRGLELPSQGLSELQMQIQKVWGSDGSCSHHPTIITIIPVGGINTSTSFSPKMVSLDAISLSQTPTGSLRRTGEFVLIVHTCQSPMAQSSVVKDGEELPGKENKLAHQILPLVKSWGPEPVLPL